jgi:predicted nucleic acid-binding protein
MEPALVDTGFWFALFDPRDQHYREAGAKADSLRRLRLVVPWPTLYETLRTRFVRNATALIQFEKFLKRDEVVYFDDSKYRERAFRLSLDSSIRQTPLRPLSMDDCLLRLVIEDADVRLRYLATFNRRDFLDVCWAKRVEFI